jgi:hypothetical protein
MGFVAEESKRGCDTPSDGITRGLLSSTGTVISLDR